MPHTKEQKSTAEYKARRAARSREMYAADAEVRKRRQEASKRSYGLHRDAKLARAKATHYGRLYGCTIEHVQSLLDAQDGRCGMCQTPLAGIGKDAGVLDHCHATGAIRGVLCQTCNRALGVVEKHFAQAMRYLNAPTCERAKISYAQDDSQDQ